ncbi:hypothetical protein Emag_002501 [Eimeria magna]
MDFPAGSREASQATDSSPSGALPAPRSASPSLSSNRDTSPPVLAGEADKEGPHYDVKALQEEGKYDGWGPLLRDILPTRGASLLLGQIRFDVTTEDERGSWLLPEELLSHQGKSMGDEQEERQVFSNTPVSEEEQRAIDDVVLHLLEIGRQGEAEDSAERARDALVMESEVYSDLRNMGACYWHGRDRKMRPLLVISLQRLQQLQREAGAEERVTRLLIFCLEFFLRYLCVAGVVENWCILCDLDGTSLVSFPLPLLLKLIQVIQGAYRGRLYRFYILHAPRLFHFVAKPLLASLPSNTARKVQVYPHLDDWHQERRTQFADHQLEKKYGGTAPDITENWYPFHFFPGPFEPAAFSTPSGEAEETVVCWKSERSLHARVHPSIHTGASLHTSLLWRRPIKKDQAEETASTDERQTLRYAAWLHHLPDLHLPPKAIRWARLLLREELLQHHNHLLQHLQDRPHQDTQREEHASHQSVDSAGDHGACSDSFDSEPPKNLPTEDEQGRPHSPVTELLTTKIADPPLSPATAFVPPHSPLAGEGSHFTPPVEGKREPASKSAVSVHVSGFTSASSSSPATQEESQQSLLPIACASVEHPAATGLNSSYDGTADEEERGRVTGLHAAVNKHKASQTTSSNDSLTTTCWESPLAHKMECCSTGPGEESRMGSLQDLRMISSTEASEHLQLIPEPPFKAYSSLEQGEARQKGNRDFKRGGDSCDSWWPNGGQALSSQLSSPGQQQSRLSGLRRLESPLQQQQQKQQQQQQPLSLHVDLPKSCSADEGSRFFGTAGRPTAAHVRAYRAMKWPLPSLSAAAADTPAAAAVSSPIAALRSLDAGDATGRTRVGGSLTHATNQWSLSDAETTGPDPRHPRTMPRVGGSNRGDAREVNVTKHVVLRRRLRSQLSVHRAPWSCADDDASAFPERFSSLNALSSAALSMQPREAQLENAASQFCSGGASLWGRRVVAHVAPHAPQQRHSCHEESRSPPGVPLSAVASNLRLQVSASAEIKETEKEAEGRVKGFEATGQQRFKDACILRRSPGRRTANKMLPLLFFAGILLPAAVAAAAVIVEAGTEGPPPLHSRSVIVQPSMCLMPWASGISSTVYTPEGHLVQSRVRSRPWSFAFARSLSRSSSSSCGEVEGCSRSSALPVTQSKPAVFVSPHASPKAATSPSFPWWQLPSTTRGGDVEFEQQLIPHASAGGVGALCMRRAVRVAAVKPKSRGSIDKRFKVTATGKLMYRRPGLQHHASTKTAARRTRLRRAASLRPSQITRLLGPLSLHP